MDSLGRLLLFRDVVEAGGFSHAAARRGLSHSTVSKHIKSLEEELGVRLLNRTSRSMSLTEAGSVVLTYSRRVGASVAELQGRLEDLRGEVVGELRVNSIVHVGRHIVQPAIARYLAANPRARVRLVLDDGPLHFSRDGYDLAVRIGLHAEGSLTARKLADNEVCLAASPDFVARWGAPTHPAQLQQLPTIGYQSREFDITTWTYTEAGAFQTVEIDPVCTVNDGNALLEMVLAGVGVGYLSRFSARAHLERGALVRLLPDYPLPPFAPLFMVYAAAPRPPRRLLAFQEHLAAVAAEVSA